VLDNTALSEKQKQDEIFEVLNQKLVEYEATIAEQKVRYEATIDEQKVHIRHLEDKNTYQKGAIDALEKRANAHDNTIIAHDQAMKAAITDLKSIFHNAQINASNAAAFGTNASNAAAFGTNASNDAAFGTNASNAAAFGANASNASNAAYNASDNSALTNINPKKKFSFRRLPANKKDTPLKSKRRSHQTGQANQPLLGSFDGAGA
jgi:uncharacterized membrane protein YkoI